MAEATYDVANALNSISSAIKTVNNNLGVLDSHIDNVESTMNNVDNNVRVIYDEIGRLANDFHEFVEYQRMANRLSNAKTDVISIKQDIEKKFGHHDTSRRHIVGILIWLHFFRQFLKRDFFTLPCLHSTLLLQGNVKKLLFLLMLVVIFIVSFPLSNIFLPIHRSLVVKASVNADIIIPVYIYI